MLSHTNQGNGSGAAVLVLGATGATGRLVVQQLLDRGREVHAVVRSRDRLPPGVVDHPKLTVTEAAVLDLSDEQMVEHVTDVEAVIQCLGHNITPKGMYGRPRDLCTRTAHRICGAIERAKPETPIKFILMNTVAVGNADGSDEHVRSVGQNTVLWLLKVLLPPMKDNLRASHYLSLEVGEKNPYVEWCTVRPDSLIDEDATAYDLHPGLTQSLFRASKTSRANVAQFMCDLLPTDSWQKWKFKLPYIINRNQS
jgi:nucleoside-diphosphate-sugar epimerase